MKLSTKGRYGLKAAYEIAKNYGEGPIPSKKIADNQRIPDNYLEQLLSVMKKAGIVKSIRGAQGGYMLAKPPEEITVGHVIRALEGEMAPSECAMDEMACDRGACCVTKKVWVKIMDSVNQVIDSITLADMVTDTFIDDI